MTPPTTSPTESQTTLPPVARPSALYIEDDPNVAKVLGRLIGKCGFEVTVVQDARRALQELQDGLHQPKVLFTDLSMPHLSGYEVAMAVREVYPDLPIVLITGALDDEAVEGRDAVTEVLLKPCKLPELRRIIARVLS